MSGDVARTMKVAAKADANKKRAETIAAGGTKAIRKQKEAAVTAPATSTDAPAAVAPAPAASAGNGIAPKPVATSSVGLRT